MTCWGRNHLHCLWW